MKTRGKTGANGFELPMTAGRTATRVSKVMRQVFGLAELRPGQQAVIDSVLARRHTLAIMPTGAGKSLCYQVPAMLMPGDGGCFAVDRVDARSVRETVGARVGGRASQQRHSRGRHFDALAPGSGGGPSSSC